MAGRKPRVTKLLYPEGTTEKDIQILEMVANLYRTPSEIAITLRVPRVYVEETISKHADLVEKMREEDTDKWKKKVHNLSRMAFSTYKEILNTPHTEPVMDKEGNVVGHTVNAQVLKTKQQIAETILNNRKALELPQGGKGGNIFIKNTVDKTRIKEIEVEREKRFALEDHLSKCKVIEAQAS